MGSAFASGVAVHADRGIMVHRCVALLETIRDRWIHARTALVASEAARAEKERARVWANRITLALAILTTLSATLVPILGQSNPVIVWTTVVAALLTTVSKLIEQVFGSPKDIANHITATGRYRALEAELTAVGGRILSHIQDGGDLDYEACYQGVRAVGDKIEETRQAFPVAESHHKSSAETSFEETQVFIAYTALTERVQTSRMGIRILHQADDALLGRPTRRLR